MKILWLTQYYAPEPAGRLVDLACELKKRGHDVQVLTGFPCYPAGKTYPGYRQSLRGRETLDGVDVLRVPQMPDHSRSVIRRVLYYLSFAFNAVWLGLLRAERPDVVMVYQSALPTGLAAWAYSRLRRVPYVVDLADLWPESVAASGMLRDQRLLSLIRRLAKFIYMGAAEINVLTEGYRQNLIGLGVDPAKINLVRWWPAKGLFGEVAQDEAFALDEGFSGRFNILYAGAIGPCQQLQTVLDAADLLRDRPEILFTIAGDGVEREDLTRRVSEMGLQNVRFIGRRKPCEITKMFALSDLLLVHLKQDPMSEVSIPSKTVDYLSSGRPLLMAVAGEASDLVRENGCGVVAVPSDAQSMASAIRGFVSLSEEERESYATAARQLFRRDFCRSEQIDRIEGSLERAQQKSRWAKFYAKRGKRLFDLSIAVPALALSALPMLLISVVIRLRMGSPILFRQQRPGLNESQFEMLKFRSMRDAYDADGNSLSDGVRLTKLGQWLRASSLDELPGLWNVVRGDMSLVGPRPLLPEYLPRYSDEQRRRHDVKPGLTGLAQVSGRNGLAWEEKFALDVQYTRAVSLSGDLKILCQTVVNVLSRSGVSAEGHPTMPVFQGSSTRRVAQTEYSTESHAA
ncbi:MAG: sugar transferase [Planctomycetota bacterium]